MTDAEREAIWDLFERLWAAASVNPNYRKHDWVQMQQKLERLLEEKAV